MGRNRKWIYSDYLARMNPGKSKEELVLEYEKKKRKSILCVVIITLLFSAFMFFLDMTNGKIADDGNIKRPDYSATNQNIKAKVVSDAYEDLDIDIEVDHQVYSEEEVKQGFKEAKSWIIEVMKDKNVSLEKIENDIFLPTVYRPMNIDISYVSSNYQLVDGKGHVYNADLEEEQAIQIQVKLSYEDYEDVFECPLIIYPKPMTAEEKFLQKINKKIAEENEQGKSNEQLLLPKEIEGQSVTFSDRREKRFLIVLVLGLLSAFFIYYAMDDDVRRQYEQRKERLLFEYPDFVSKLALLIGAGMSFNGAIRRIHAEKSSPELYKELNIFVHNLDNGILENRAIDDFGKRIGLPQYRKFCALISVNLKKGSVNLKEMLQMESEQAFENHQSQIRKKGEEAGTKLLVPMVIMLTIVIAIVMIPAFFTYQIS